MSERLTDQQLQILWEQWQPAAIELLTLRAENEQLRRSVGNIRAVASSKDGSRTFDQCIVDLGWIDDECRAALSCEPNQVDKPGG